MSGRRARGRARGSPFRSRGRGRGKVQDENESVEVSPVSTPLVSDAVDPSNSVSDKAATVEPNTLDDTIINDLVESCNDNLQSTDAALKTTLESKESEVNTDVINIDADTVSLAVNVTDRSLKRSSNEPDIIELDSDDDDDAPSKVKEKEEASSNVDAKESFVLEASANEKHVFEASDVINLDDDDDDDDDKGNDHETAKDERHFYCDVCDIDCKTKQTFERHEEGSYHCQKLKKATEVKTVKDKQVVDAAADAEVAAETDQVNNEEEKEMESELDASIAESIDLTKSNSIWILVDQVDEMEDEAEDRSADVTHEDSSPAEGKEAPDTVLSNSIGDNKVEALSDRDGQTMEKVHDDCGIDGREGSDSTEVAKKVVTDEGKRREADDHVVPLNEKDEMAATQSEAIDGEWYTLDREGNTEGLCDATSSPSIKENTDHAESKEVYKAESKEVYKAESKEVEAAESKEVDKAESKEVEAAESKEVDKAESKEVEEAEFKEQGEHAGKSDESETDEDSTEQGDSSIDPYYCSACDVRCETDKAYHMHTRGMMHTLNCGSSSSAADRPKPVPQVYRVPKTAKKKSGTKKPKEKKPVGIGTDGDAILIEDDEESDETEEEDEVEEVEDADNSKDYKWIAGGVADENYYCDICECSVTSERNYEDHLVGARHKKNKRNRDLGVPIKKSKGTVAIGGHQAKVVDCEPRAQEMLDSCKDPLIGLQYMTEFCHLDPDVEPRYICNLCEAKCDVRMVILHLTGLRHRLKYLTKHHTNYAILVQQRTRKSDQTPLADEFANEIEASNGRQKMVVKMDMGGDAASGALEGDTKDKQESRKRPAPSGNSKSSYRRTSPIDVRSVSPEDRRRSAKGKELACRVRRRSRSGSRHRDRSPRRLSSRRRSRSRSRDRHNYRDRYSKDVDYRDRWRDRRSGEKDRDDRDSTGGGGRRWSEYSRRDQDSRSEQHGLLSAAQVIYGTTYPYAQMAGVQYGLVSPAAFAMGSSYPAALGSNYPINQRAICAAPPSPKRSRFSDASPAVSLPMSYPPPNMMSMYGALGAVAASPYASMYGAPRLLGAPPQPVPPVTQSPLPSKGSAGYERSFKLPSPATYGSKQSGTGNVSSRVASSDDAYSTLSSIVASVGTGTRDDDEAAAMSKVIAEAVIKYKMQKAQEKSKQMPPPDKYQRRY